MNQFATVNDVPIVSLGETPTASELRERAYRELLRQAAIADGLLAQGRDAESARNDDEIEAAIEKLLDQKLHVPEPEDATCRRYFAANRARFQRGERVRARHILFAVTPGVDVVALRQRAEAALLDVRSHERTDTARFDRAAKALSNCPSSVDGGDLGWLRAEDCAPEFAKEIFGKTDLGVLPRLVHTRFGLHVVEVIAREPGAIPEYETVARAVAQAIRQRSYVTALSQYLRLLASDAKLVGIDLATADSPLLQ
jgi:peptidyl-prolyl cis-trans isomerase C